MKSLSIDLNADLGEYQSADQQRIERELLRYVSSANIASGGHCGDADTMRATVMAALEHGVALGAHPSIPDRVGFGRRESELRRDRVAEFVTEQIMALAEVVAAAGGQLGHVKPHGALYNMAARDVEVAGLIVSAIGAVDSRLCIVGLAGGELCRAGAAAGHPVLAEGFVDRRYCSDGSLMPRSEAGAVIEATQDACAQALSLARREPLQLLDGSFLRLEVASLCLHGDHADALQRAAAVYTALREAGIDIVARTLGGGFAGQVEEHQARGA